MHMRNKDSGCDSAVVCFNGDKVSLDESTARRFSNQLLAIAEAIAESRLILDVENVEFVSSVALGTLVNLHKRLAGKGRCLTIDNLSRQVLEVFVVTRLDKLLDLRPANPDGWAMVDGFPNDLETGVLVVDDEPAVLSMLESMLRHAGFNVWTSVHGYQAADQYRRLQKDITVVLLDVRMPGLDGPQTLDSLRKVDPLVRCCFMTGNPQPYTEDSLLKMGALRVFRKPFAMVEFVSTFKQLTASVC
jgi:anti-anti-sigma factor